MSELLEFSGSKGYLLLAMGVGGTLGALGALGLSVFTRAFRPALTLAGVTLGLGMATLLMGSFGRFMDVRTTYRAMAYADPDDRMRIFEGGKREAQASLTLGAMAGAPLVLLSLAAMGAAFARTGAPR